MKKHTFMRMSALCATVALLSVALSSCNDKKEIDDELPPSAFTITVDASDFGKWSYVNLSTKSVETRDIPTELTGEWDGRSGITFYNVQGGYTELSKTNTDAQTDPETWDIAFHYFDVKTNGGSVLETSYSSLDQLPTTNNFQGSTFTPDEWNTQTVIVDRSGMMAYNIGYQNSMVNTVLSGWANMDFSTPPPTYSTSDKVYIVKLKDGSFAAMKLRDYMDDNGKKGILTIEVIYPYK